MITFKTINGDYYNVYIDEIVGVIPYSQSDGVKIVFQGSKILLKNNERFVVCAEPKEVFQSIRNRKQVGWYSEMEEEFCRLDQKEIYPITYARCTVPVFISEV